MLSVMPVSAARVSAALRGVTAAINRGVCDSAITSRPPWTNPASASTGTVTATPTSQPVAFPYQVRNRSQKWKPMQPWTQAMRMRNAWNVPRQGDVTQYTRSTRA